MRLRIYWMAVLGLAVSAAACTSEGDPGSTTSIIPPPATTTTPPTPETTPSQPTTTTSTTATTQPEEELDWPNAPDRYAFVGLEGITLVEGEQSTSLDTPDEAPVEAGFVGDQLVFAAGCCDGIWVWQYQDADTGPIQVVGANDSETRVRLHGVVQAGDRPGFFYSETGPAEDSPAQLMFHDTATGESELFFEIDSRHADLSAEEQIAHLGTVSAGPDRVAVLFAFGDETWLEWYDREGAPVEGLAQPGPEDTILDMVVSPSGDRLAIATESTLHAGITDISIVDQNDETLDTFSLTEGQSLRDLHYDGRWLTGSLHEERSDVPAQPQPVGSHAIDTESGDSITFDQIGSIALSN